MSTLLLALLIGSSATNGPTGGTAYTAGTGLTLTGSAFSLTAPVSVANGGTNATSASAARSQLSAAASGSNSDITALTGLSTPLAVGQGGTGSATQNFVDLTTSQASIAGNKTFSGSTTLSGGLTIATNNLVLGTGSPIIDVRNSGTFASFANGPYGTFSIRGASAVMLNFVTASTGDTMQIPSGIQLWDSAATGITAAGTNQATCTQLANDKSNVTTVASGTGVCLPPTAAGAHFIVHTSGANSLFIYANPAGGTLNGQGASAGITLVNTAGAAPGSRVIDCYSSTLCFSAATLPDAN